jgi:malate dehydrogenase (oxaloacetate-decarboxylating)(NADP+)
MKIRRQEALDYHEQGRPGKIEVTPTKPYSTQRDLSLAYSPGVAEPCLEIEKDPKANYKYTAKGNLVAVISNGTAVLGLGNLGAEASKPVMEGKGLLFKIFADIDVFDIEVDATDVDEFVNTVKNIAPTFGGINLEDIKAPEAFEIERRLKEELNIPVMHDDQHGTAIISGAALLNAVEITGRKIEEVKMVVVGAGASAISCSKLFLALGLKKENLVMLDSKGVIRKDRTDLNSNKQFFATERDLHALEDAIEGADVFLGLSRGGILKKEMVKKMADNPVIFALANPDPEISYVDAKAAREDVIIATGRSDHPNQVNNVLGFPYIFRGALDVMATEINEEMKLAAVRAIAQLAREAVPEEVNIAYHKKNLVFGEDYIIPKPLDYRLITWVAPAVAKAAMESGVAQRPIEDWGIYKQQLDERMGLDNKLISSIMTRARRDPRKVVFAEADHPKVLKAAQIVRDEGIAKPVLLGRRSVISEMAEIYQLDLEGMKIINPRADELSDKRKEYGQIFFEKRKRKGFTLPEAEKIMRERNYYGSMMVDKGEADAFISGLSRNYPDTLRPALRTIGKADEVDSIVGMYVLITKKGPLFFADTTVNLDPTAEELVHITTLVAHSVKRFQIEPHIAMLSYSNFGSSQGPDAEKVRKAVKILREEQPHLKVDGEVQANFALNKGLMKEIFPFSTLAENKVNTLIFPNLSSGNIAYKLLQEMSDVELLGPILVGMKKPVHVLQLGSSVREIVNMVALAVVDAQTR